MRANSRNSIRGSIATTVIALILGALPATFDADGNAVAGKAALADGGGNGRLVAVNPMPPPDADGAQEQGRPQAAPSIADDAHDSRVDQADQRFSNNDDGDRIGDDSDIASVDGSANDSDAAQDEAGPMAAAAKSTADAPGDLSDETF